MYKPLDNVNQPLYVIAVVSNFARFKTRWKLYRDFAKHVRDAGAILVTVECAFGEREFSLEDNAPSGPLGHSGKFTSHGPAPNPPAALLDHTRNRQEYIKVRADSNQELWLKEALGNIGLQHLPENARYVAFIDADVSFVRPDWVSETLHQLQHYDVVQMFSTAIDMTPDHEPMQAYRGMMYSYVNGGDPVSEACYYGSGLYYWHPGFAWAWRRSALDRVGGLYDQAILGAGDHHMAWSLLGMYEKTFPAGASAGYRYSVAKWQSDALCLNKNVGYVNGALLHHWHGKKVDRRYNDRWKVLVDAKYDPYTDLRKDWRGLYSLTNNKPALRDGIRAYFRARDEDSIDVNPAENQILGSMIQPKKAT